MYEVYSGGSKPTWKYKSFGALKRRLSNLAQYSAIAKVVVQYPHRNRIEATTVTFSRSSSGFGWYAEPDGLPTRLGMGNFTTRQVNFHKGK